MAPEEIYMRWAYLDHHIIYGKFFTTAISFRFWQRRRLFAISSMLNWQCWLMPITFPHICSLWRSRLLHCSPPLVLTSLVSPGFTQGLRRVSLLRAKPHGEDSTFGVSPCFPEKQETRTTAFSRESEVLSRTVWLTEHHGKTSHPLFHHVACSKPQT